MLNTVQTERGVRVEIDRGRDRLLTDFGRAVLSDRYLMPGEDYQDLFARVASHYADDTAHAQRIYTYISKLWFMPATPVLSNGGTSRGLADLLLPERSLGQPGRHRRAVERERLAGREGRRHRQLLGQPALDRREGRRQRQDLRRDPVHPGDGQPHPGDQPGLAAPRQRRRLPAGRPPGSGGIRRAAPADRRRPEPQGAEPAPRPADFRRVHARRRGRRGMGADQPEGPDGGTHGFGPRAVDPHPDRADRDRRALSWCTSTT